MHFVSFPFLYVFQGQSYNMLNPHRPSALELQALSVLYSVGPSTVAVVLENIPDGKVRAYTTILSVMQSLERKGLAKPA
ncbi:MAG: BlaI/MecI/CopY family transcriptional regulator, partial [Roseibacillus sp.]|nr:BlaI/MecI/CopY family transcriptional regulator [Roseibacillus sp.]